MSKASMESLDLDLTLTLKILYLDLNLIGAILQESLSKDREEL